MEVRLAEHMGFCFGVRRAEDLIEKAASEHGQMTTLGQLVHNRQVAARLRELGVRAVNSLEEVDTPVVAISAHGAPPETAEIAARHGLKVIDGTCPFVRKAQLAARELAQQGFAVLIFGDPAHREVKGILGWAGTGARVMADEGALPAECPGRKVGIVSQTTQNVDNLRKLTEAVTARWLVELAELRVVNTICYASVDRQQAAEELAREVDVIVVIGGRDSANTGRLSEVCARTGTPVHQVEDVDALQRDWFTGVRVVGVTAGASTPDWVIGRVTGWLQELS
ncbi:MAG: 4-hydroxy-3-methylbut-2-enyl diphosphate reductase [Dehalococcoidales bacterium]|nr:4-hydroxy-3-methylbut-2-enyl diphosphate reductase [Dehalococcoidales bacterium]